MIEQDMLTRHAALARTIAADGMVLLANRADVLPLKPGCRTAFFGRGQLDFSQGGTGAAAVKSLFHDTLASVVGESDCPIAADRELSDRYRNDAAFMPDDADLAAAAKRCDVACLILSRNAGEGTDRRDIPGDFRLSPEEELLLERLGRSPFRQVVAVVNSGGIIALDWFSRYDNFKALLLAWQPGMCGIRALIDVLSGRVNPSGRLADTIAGSHADWPSAAEFQTHRRRLEYTDDVYVGYRYFETLPGQASQVLYPFGYGLSYTSFSLRSSAFACDGTKVSVAGNVVNTGTRPGREVVQCYAGMPGNDRPARELCAFVKTGEIAPGGTAEFHLEFPLEALRRFDDTGEVCGRPGSFVLEAGSYRVFIGASIRDLHEAGRFEIEQTRILETPGNLFLALPAGRLHADGTKTGSGSFFAETDESCEDKSPSRRSAPITLDMVASGKNTLEEFLGQLTPRELVHLCHGQPPAQPNCTGGIGGLPRYGVPTLQTADGPAGIRSGHAATCFPCATLAACTWDMELLCSMGKAIAREGRALGLDILLAPGLNIHRDPLNGRNFEYYSEDPLLAGKCAAAFVKGVQSAGMGATIKHFACNSRENFRRLCDSIVSDRALREIYLRGFEIAVKEGHPQCVMSSYNLINGMHTSTSYALLTQLLRKEWGFDGIVMTDWITTEPLWKELLAGNDLKMPCIPEAEAESTARMEIDMDRIPVVPRRVMETSARRILSLILKSPRFREHRPVSVTRVPSQGLQLGTADVIALSHSAVSIAPTSDPGRENLMFCNLKRNYWNTDAALYYRLSFAEKGRYTLRFRIATPSETLLLRLEIDGRVIGTLPIRPTFAPAGEVPPSSQWDRWITQGEIPVEADRDTVMEFRLVFVDPERIGGALHFVEIVPCKSS